MADQPSPTEQSTAVLARPDRLRVDRVRIAGFKAFRERFEFEFPPPRCEDDLDITVIGSVNGVGKTSLLDAVALALTVGACRMAVHLGLQDDGIRRDGLTPGTAQDAVSRLIASGVRQASVVCECSSTEGTASARVALTREPNLLVAGSSEGDARAALGGAVPGTRVQILEALAAATGATGEPLAVGRLLYLHSNRWISPHNPALGDLAEGTPRADAVGARGLAQSVFKLAVIHAIQDEKGVFGPAAKSGDQTLGVLNELIGTFARGRVSRLTWEGKTYGIPIETGDGEDLLFDCLGSGQKEAIATLFLIWHSTREYPGVVLIDEPELHLNEEWHGLFVRSLHKLAPWNQYIIATHSRRVAESVDPDRLFYLDSGRGPSA